MTAWKPTDDLRKVIGAYCTFALARPDRSRVLGAGSSGYTRISLLLDLETGGWTRTPGTMTGSIEDHALVTLDDGRVLAVGGRNAAADVATCELFDPATLAWTSGPSMSRPRHAPAVVCVAGHVLAIGGCGPDCSVDPRAVEVLRPRASAWTSLSPGGELDIEYKSSRSITSDVTSILIGSPDGGWTSTCGPGLSRPRIVRVSERGSSEQVFVVGGSGEAHIIRV